MTDALTKGSERLAVEIQSRTVTVEAVRNVIKANPGLIAIFANYANMQAELYRLQIVVGEEDYALIDAVLADAFDGLTTWRTGQCNSSTG